MSTDEHRTRVNVAAFELLNGFATAQDARLVVDEVERLRAQLDEGDVPGARFVLTDSSVTE